MGRSTRLNNSVYNGEIFEWYVLNTTRTKETSDFEDVDNVFFLMIWSRKVVVRHKTCTINTEYRIRNPETVNILFIKENCEKLFQKLSDCMLSI